MRRTLRFAAALIPLIAVSAGAAAPAAVVPGVRLLRGGFAPGAQPDGNTVIIDAPGGLVVIDTGRHAAHTQAILDLAKNAGRPIVAVVNTHWHLDHIGGNAAIRAAHPEVRVYASGALEQARAGFLASYRRQLEEMLRSDPPAGQKSAFEAEIRLIDQGAKLAPDVVIERSGSVSFAGAPFRLGLEAGAVTAGDVWLLDESRGVLVAGDLITLPAPFLDTACPAGWKKSLDRLAALEFDLVIPGHGAPLTRTQFEIYRKAFGSLLDCAGAKEEKERCVDAWVAAVAPLEPGDEAFTRTLMRYYVDLLRGDAVKTRCP
ncbi:MAG TPA: MBL fold metallo-hydrolase [Thermoanaerobaculia bacterium]|nr:MBL fold metallo-hydrolase [Thermoanaerobaculia bacterium]